MAYQPLSSFDFSKLFVPIDTVTGTQDIAGQAKKTGASLVAKGKASIGGQIARGVYGQTAKGLGIVNDAIETGVGLPGRAATGFNSNVPAGFMEQVGGATEGLTGSKTAGMIAGLAAGIIEPFPGGKAKALKTIVGTKAAKPLFTKVVNSVAPKGFEKEIESVLFDKLTKHANEIGIKNVDSVNGSIALENYLRGVDPELYRIVEARAKQSGTPLIGGQNRVSGFIQEQFDLVKEAPAVVGAIKNFSSDVSGKLSKNLSNGWNNIDPYEQSLGRSLLETIKEYKNELIGDPYGGLDETAHYMVNAFKNEKAGKLFAQLSRDVLKESGNKFLYRTKTSSGEYGLSWTTNIETAKYLGGVESDSEIIKIPITRDVLNRVLWSDSLLPFLKEHFGKKSNLLKQIEIGENEVILDNSVQIKSEQAKQPVIMHGNVGAKTLVGGAIVTGAAAANEADKKLSTSVYNAPDKSNMFVKSPTIDLERFGTKLVRNVENTVASTTGKDLYKVVGVTGDLGKYQVNPQSLKDWSKAWLGRAYSTAEFLADPKAQEKFFKEFGNLVSKYRLTEDESAVTWHSGWGKLGTGLADREKRFRDYLRNAMTTPENQRYLALFNGTKP